MRRFAAVALLLAGVALPVCGQRGGGHGGFSGSAPSRFAGNGFSSARFSAPSRFAGSPQFRPAPSSPRAGFGASNFRPSYSSNGRGAYGSSRYRRIYVSRGGAWSSYIVPGWIGPGYLGYPYGYDDDSGYDNPAVAGNYAGQGYDTQQDEPQVPNPYYASAGTSNPSPAPKSEDAVTVLFKDGRPPEEIHNYALTRTTLYVMDEHHRDIPVDEIDLDATEKLNREAGVDFKLPVALR
jgi:hypothetical protein